MFLPMNSSSFHRRKYAAGKCSNVWTTYGDIRWIHSICSKFCYFWRNDHSTWPASMLMVVMCVCIHFGFRAISFIHFVAMDDVCECFGQNTTNEKLDSHEYAYIICTIGISSEKAKYKEWKKRQNWMRNFVQPGALHWWINGTCFFTSVKCFDFIVSSFIGRFLFLLLCCCSCCSLISYKAIYVFSINYNQFSSTTQADMATQRGWLQNKRRKIYKQTHSHTHGHESICISLLNSQHQQHLRSATLTRPTSLTRTQFLSILVIQHKHTKPKD